MTTTANEGYQRRTRAARISNTAITSYFMKKPGNPGFLVWRSSGQFYSSLESFDPFAQLVEQVSVFDDLFKVRRGFTSQAGQ
jgi:hypothetical protein